MIARAVTGKPTLKEAMQWTRDHPLDVATTASYFPKLTLVAP